MAFNPTGSLYGAGSPHSFPNPFEKYKTARDAAADSKKDSAIPGMLGIGTGSYADRYSGKRVGGERRRVARLLVFLVLCGLAYLFLSSRTPSDGTVGRGRYEPVPHVISTVVPDASKPEEAKIPVPAPEDEGPTKVATTDTGIQEEIGEVRPVVVPAADARKQVGAEKATIVMLVRNGDLKEALKSMRQVEDRFNRVYKYPWTFLNDAEFTQEFKDMTTRMASGLTEYGFIKPEQWGVPPHINQTRMQETLANMKAKNVIYGDSVPYRHMCRYNSGFFYRHELMMKYDWYWRVEPSIGFFCTVDYDLFTFMRRNDKKYGWVQSLPEYFETIPTLWTQTVGFLKENPQYLAKNHSLKFLLADNAPSDASILSDPQPEYNRCHFWSNFEIGDLNFWRGEAYSKYFDRLDQAGGFYYERWGDAPVHSLAVSLFLDTQQVHHFADLGYHHPPWGRCPQPPEFYNTGKCVCPFEPQASFDHDAYSCTPRWWKIAGKNYGA